MFVIEARDLDHALALAKMTPIVEGGVEVRPLLDFQVVGLTVELAVADAHRREWAYVLAATVRVTRDLDLAEDAVQEAYVSALGAWERDGVPERPGAWLTTAARRVALNALTRRKTLRTKLPLLLEPEETEMSLRRARSDPGRPSAARLHLLPSRAGARGAGRADAAAGVRRGHARHRARVPRERVDDGRADHAGQEEDRGGGDPVRRAGEPQRALGPGADRDPPARRRPVTPRRRATRWCGVDLSDRALDLARMLRLLLPDEREVAGLLALLLVHHARAATRVDDDGRLLRLSEQDRLSWDAGAITEADALVVAALRAGPPGRFTLQAAIAALHAQAPSYEETDWPQLLELYDALLRVWPSPVVALNRAVVVVARSTARRRRWRRSRRSSATAAWPRIATSRPRRPTCCGAWAATRRPARPTAPRWR